MCSSWRTAGASLHPDRRTVEPASVAEYVACASKVGFDPHRQVGKDVLSLQETRIQFETADYREPSLGSSVASVVVGTTAGSGPATR